MLATVGRLNENSLEIFAKLYTVAYKHLTMVETPVPSQRLFSKAGHIVNQQQNRFKGKLLNKLLFLQSVKRTLEIGCV